MEVLVRDCDLVSLILEFLHSRDLFSSALALERETGCQPRKDELLPEDLKFLRQFVLDGKWERVLSFVEPLTYLEEFDSRAFHYLVLRQRYFEALHSNSLSTNRSAQDIAFLKLTLEDVKPYCSQEEFQQLCQAHNHSVLHNWEVVSSRFQCFQSILLLVGPFYDEVASTAEGGASFQNNLSAREATNQSSDLQSLVISALFYDECSKYYREKANCSNTDTTFLSTQSLNHTQSNNSVNADLLFWLRSISDTSLFQHRLKEEEIQVKVEQLKDRPTQQKSATKRNSSSHPLQGVQPNYIKTVSSPTLSQNLNLPPSKQQRVPSNSISSSGPALLIKSGDRNRSNNNNNDTELVGNAIESVTHSPREDRNVIKNSEGSSSPKQIEKLLSSKSPRRDNLGGRLNEKEPQQPVDSSGVKSIPKLVHVSGENGKDDPSKLSDEQHPDMRFLRDSANLVREARHRVTSSIKVQDSYDRAQEEKQKIKLENQNFLKQLEEKEKEKEEIRKMLRNQTQENITKSPRIQENDPVHLVDDGAVDPPPVKVRYLPVEVTEDSASIRAVSFHPSGLVYSIGSNSKTLRICEVPRDTIARFIQETKNLSLTEGLENLTPKPSKVLIKRPRHHTGSIYSMAWNEEGSMLATCSNDKLIKLLGFDVLGKTLDDTPHRMGFHRGVVRDVQFLNGRGNILTSAGGDGFVYITDCSKSTNISQLPGHSDSILSLWAWKNDMLGSSSQDKSIRLWDIRTSRCVSIIGVGTRNPGVPTSICVNPDGRILAVGLDNNNIGLYDLAAGKILLEYKAHDSEVRSVRFNPVQNHLLLSSSYDGTIALTDVAGLLSEADPSTTVEHHLTTIGRCGDKVIQCRWHPNGEDFASTSTDQTCKLWHRFGSSV